MPGCGKFKGDIAISLKIVSCFQATMSSSPTIFKNTIATNYAVYVNDTSTTTTTYTKNLTTAGSTNIACGLSISKGNAIRLSIDPNSTAVSQFLVTLVFE